jgi:lipopolysaccharide/colanic/teichoic acid biosynthesis glycosyltransferase
VGRHGKIFRVVKIKTMRSTADRGTTVTTDKDPRITRLGRLFRKTKIDELPQLWNVLVGDMSFVGPRPDVPGFADRLEGTDRVILQLRPGITGPATLKYRDEEVLLAEQEDPERFNREVIWPDKVRINRDYACNWSLSRDIACILRTIAG